jgi:hypothetical protein
MKTLQNYLNESLVNESNNHNKLYKFVEKIVKDFQKKDNVQSKASNTDLFRIGYTSSEGDLYYMTIDMKHKELASGINQGQYWEFTPMSMEEDDLDDYIMDENGVSVALSDVADCFEEFHSFLQYFLPF